MKKFLALFLTAVLIVSAIAGCAPAETSQSQGGSQSQGDSQSQDTEQEVVKIAVYAPMTGDHAEYGNSFKVAAEIQADFWNAKGGAGGMKVEIVSYDDKNSGEEAAAIAERVGEDMDVVGIIGSYISGTSMAATPTFQEYGLTNISSSASHPDFTKAGNYIFRNNTIISVEGGATVDAVKENLQAKNVGMMYIKTDWGLSTSEIVRELCKEKGVNLVAEQECMDGSDDYSVQIATFRDAGCDAIIVVGMHNTFVPFARQYRQLDPEIGLAAFANLYDQQVIDLGGEYVEGTVFPVAYFNESTDPKVVEFRDEFTKRFGKAPSSLAAQAYDAAGILMEAIDNVGSKDRAAIRDYVEGISYEGVGGTITFDENRDAIKVFMRIQIQDGKFVQIG